MGILLLDGLKAMVLGMRMVLVFLVIMIILMNIMSRLLKPFANLLEKPVAPKKAAKKASGAKALSAEDKLLAKAAVEAVKMYRGEK